MNVEIYVSDSTSRSMTRHCTKICVCVCTSDRLEYLGDLLQSFMEFRTIEGIDVDLLIVDNGITTEAKKVYELWSDRLPIPTHLTKEPMHGIPFARNRAVQVALDVIGADFVAFIDDDDLPRPDWLKHLLAAAILNKADLVFGSWIWAGDTAIPEHLKGSFFFREENDKTNDFGLPQRIATCNVLINRRILDEIRSTGPVFSSVFAGIGGEDTEFFVRATKLGATFCRCSDSLVLRRWDPDRCTYGSVLRRAFAFGVSQGLIAKLHTSRRELPRKVLKTSRQIAKIFYRLFIDVVLGRKYNILSDFAKVTARTGQLYSFIGGSFRYYR